MHESLSVAAVGYMLPKNNKFSYLHIHSPFLYAYSINLVWISSLFRWGSKKICIHTLQCSFCSHRRDRMREIESQRGLGCFTGFPPEEIWKGRQQRAVDEMHMCQCFMWACSQYAVRAALNSALIKITEWQMFYHNLSEKYVLSFILRHIKGYSTWAATLLNLLNILTLILTI